MVRAPCSMLVTIAWYLFWGGFLSIFIIIARKIPVLRNVPLASLENAETFFEFVARKVREIPEFPSCISHGVLSLVEKYLHRAKILSLRLHNVFDGWRTSVRDKKNGTPSLLDAPTVDSGEEKAE